MFRSYLTSSGPRDTWCLRLPSRLMALQSGRSPASGSERGQTHPQTPPGGTVAPRESAVALLCAVAMYAILKATKGQGPSSG